MKLIKIDAAVHDGDYRLRIYFNDGVVKLVDFEHFLTSATHPLTRSYLDQSKFKQFELTDGDLHWHDFSLCVPLYQLYRGHVEHKPLLG